MQEIRVKYSAGKVNARAKELQDMLNSLDLAAKPTILDGLAFSFRTAGKAYHGMLIKKGMEALPTLLLHHLNIEMRELLKEVTDGGSEHIN